nr:CapA family protein [Proteus mirabilis]
MDKVIILPHWGIENQFFPTAEQVCFARRLIDAGADAIIGTHTHTIQSHEIYNKKHIYYSIGILSLITSLSPQSNNITNLNLIKKDYL